MALYAHIMDGAIVQAPVTLPFSAKNHETGDWVTYLYNENESVQEACGYFRITENEAPTVGVTQRVDGPDYVLIDGRPVQQWDIRPETAQEAAERTTNETRTTNRATLELQARSAVGANNNFLAIAIPTQAQVLAQVRLLTRQCNGFIKLLAVVNKTMGDDLLDDTTGT